MSGRVLSEEAIREWEQVAMEGGSCTAEGIEWFIATIQDRDKTIAEFDYKVERDKRVERYKSLWNLFEREYITTRDERDILKQQNTLMLSALEYVEEFMVHGTETHKMVRQTIAKVKGGDS